MIILLKNLKKGLFFTVLFAFVFSCSNPSIVTDYDSDKALISENSIFLSLNSDPVIQSATIVAQNRLDEIKNRNRDDWDDKSIIIGCYPIYMPGSDNTPDYYEFKVTTNGEDAGYILVSINKADIQIPEIATEGKTLTEMYQDATKSNGIKVIRFDWFKSAAESNEKSRNGETKLLATMGFNGNGLELVNDTRNSNSAIIEEYIKIKNDYSLSIKKDGCLPYYSKKGLDDYYYNIEKGETTRGGGGSVPTIKYDDSELKNKFACGWHLPQWTQPTCSHGGGRKVGCGPTAWAMVYAYWRQFKGKSSLFPGGDLNYGNNSRYQGSFESFIKQVMEAIHIYCETEHGAFSETWGLTWPDKMNRAAYYAHSRGYSATVRRQTIAGDWTGGTNFIFSEINNDRPCVLYFSTESGGLHYGAIEEVEKRYWSNTGYVTELGMHVNYGQSNKRRWVYAFSDTFKTTNACYEVWSLSIY